MRNKRKISRPPGARAAEIRAYHRTRHNGYHGEHPRARLYRLRSLLYAPYGHLQQQRRSDTKPRADSRRDSPGARRLDRHSRRPAADRDNKRALSQAPEPH